MTIFGGILQKIEEMFMVYYKYKYLWHTVIVLDITIQILRENKKILLLFKVKASQSQVLKRPLFSNRFELFSTTIWGSHFYNT